MPTRVVPFERPSPTRNSRCHFSRVSGLNGRRLAAQRLRQSVPRVFHRITLDLLPAGKPGAAHLSALDNAQLLPQEQDLPVLVTVVQAADGEHIQKEGPHEEHASNHLGYLQDCGLVVADQNIRHSIYRLSDDGIDRLLNLADIVLADIACGVSECTRYNEPKTARTSNQ
jgi:hypothetical protein